ncbi:MAG: hypothetical protein JWO58_39 [Chitinophagaceae bacterium]|nr:hypothetical protein [Chitinophagaceae bacterium]
MKHLLLYSSCILLFSFGSCQRLNSVSSDTSTDLTPKDELTKPANLQLINSRWVLLEINGKAVHPKSEVFIHFVDETAVNGFGGCNTFKGKYTTDGADIKIGPLMSTKMACEDLSIESQFTDVLQRTESYKADEKYLYLKNEDGVLAKLSAKHL